MLKTKATIFNGLTSEATSLHVCYILFNRKFKDRLLHKGLNTSKQGLLGLWTIGDWGREHLQVFILQ